MINYSRQRSTVLEVLRSTKTHPTADWVYEQCKKVIPNISLGTVYRNLNLLVDLGEAIRVKGDFEKDRFDGDVHPHCHMVCSRCGAVVDVELDSVLDESVRAFISNNNIPADSYDITFTGVCSECSEAN